MQIHTPVLVDELLHVLALSRDATVIDATFGSAGHATALLSALGARGRYLGIDADPVAIKEGHARIKGARANTSLVCANFRDIRNVARSAGIVSADAIYADLGWRIEQFREGAKGFSFLCEEPLLMTYGSPRHYPFTASDIVNSWKEETLADMLFGYAGERRARHIARAIVVARRQQRIETSLQLANIVAGALPPAARHKRIHPATKTFQALRIAVNDELGALSAFIENAAQLLHTGGTLAIITFHSVEDSLVKQTFRTLLHHSLVELVNKKPLTPTSSELRNNPRARSAKLRAIRKV